MVSVHVVVVLVMELLADAQLVHETREQIGVHVELVNQVLRFLVQVRCKRIRIFQRHELDRIDQVTSQRDHVLRNSAVLEYFLVQNAQTPDVIDVLMQPKEIDDRGINRRQVFGLEAVTRVLIFMAASGSKHVMVVEVRRVNGPQQKPLHITIQTQGLLVVDQGVTQRVGLVEKFDLGLTC